MNKQDLIDRLDANVNMLITEEEMDGLAEYLLSQFCLMSREDEE